MGQNDYFQLLYDGKLQEAEQLRISTIPDKLIKFIRLLDELYSEDFPSEVITTEPVLLEWYIGKLFLFAKEAINGQYMGNLQNIVLVQQKE